MSQVVTRFAPSPTGNLHVGGARTALYNWAYARRHGGKFILRLEDTDKVRSTVEAARGILRDLAWLGIDWDEGPEAGAEDPFTQQKGPSGPYCQSQRLDLYNEHIERLIRSGHAYEDEGAVRFKAPAQDVTVQDAVLGNVTTRAGEIEDFVIKKADGFPTYHLAVVVDDATMGVSHVIRGQEHLNNTPKHWAIQEALGLPHPTYAHIPLIFNHDGSKMSKRDKAKAARAAARDWIEQHEGITALRAMLLAHEFVPILSKHFTVALDDEAINRFMEKQSDDMGVAQLIAEALGIHLPEIDVADFRDSGHLPAPLCNYLTLLGWNPGGDREKFDNAFLAERFDFDRVGKSNARFDRQKLLSFNQDAIAELPAAEWITALWHSNRTGFSGYFESAQDPRFIAFAEAYQGRSKTLRDPIEQGAFFFAQDEDIAYTDEKSLKKVMLKNDGEGFAALENIKPVLEGLEDWTPESLHAAIQSFCDQNDLGMGKVAQPIRFAVSGTTVTPPLDKTLFVLGKPATLARIERCLNTAPRELPA